MRSTPTPSPRALLHGYSATNRRPRGAPVCPDSFEKDALGYFKHIDLEVTVSCLFVKLSCVVFAVDLFAL